jgi:hypothetical protein
MIEIVSWIANLFMLGLSLIMIGIGCFCMLLIIIAGKDLIERIK